MDFMDSYLAYEGDTLRYYIKSCGTLTQEQWRQPFDVGQGSLAENVGHIIRNMEFWTDLMRGVPDTKRQSVPENPVDALPRYDSALAYFTEYARSVAADGRLDDTYPDTRADEPVYFGYGMTILHVLVHNTGHRGEIQHMLQRLGVPSELDSDVLEWDYLKNHPEQHPDTK